MNISTISYWFYEAFESMKKNIKNVLISVSTMIATMLIVAIGYLVLMNANYIEEQKQEFNSKALAFLELDVTEAEVANINTRLKGIDGVTNVEYFTQEESIKKAAEMNKMFTYAYTEEALKDMYPPFFRITFETIEAEREVVNTLKTLEGIGKGETDIGVTASAEEAINKAQSMQVIAITAMILIIELSVFLIMNTTKLMLYARRKEISIMKYVGAKDAFVKMPFAIEGIIMSLIGVLIVILMVSLCYEPALSMINQDVGYKYLTLEEVMPNLRLMLIVIGILIGAFGSTLSMNKYLDV